MQKQFIVDPKKCKGSRVCDTACPGNLISINEKTNLPFWIEGAEQQCILCHRCVISCPNLAITIKKIKEDGDDVIRNFLFKIDAAKCLHDGACAIVCPLQLIIFNVNEKDKLPIPIEQAEKLCIHCGQCVAVCPTGAFKLDTTKPGKLTVDMYGVPYFEPVTRQTMKPEDCEPFNPEFLPSSEQIKHFLRSRRSIRAFQSQSVDRVTLSHIIDTICYAPTARNSQSVNWLVIEDAEEVKYFSRLAIDWMRRTISEKPGIAQNMHLQRLVDAWDKGRDPICHGAPHVILAHAKDDMPGAQIDCTIALTYLELVAHSAGVGTCWAGFFNAAANFYPPMMDALNLPDGHQCFGAKLVGYSRIQYHRIPLRKKANITWR